jgi:hypothetical protein
MCKSEVSRPAAPVTVPQIGWHEVLELQAAEYGHAGTIPVEWVENLFGPELVAELVTEEWFRREYIQWDQLLFALAKSPRLAAFRQPPDEMVAIAAIRLEKNEVVRRHAVELGKVQTRLAAAVRAHFIRRDADLGRRLAEEATERQHAREEQSRRSSQKMSAGARARLAAARGE